MYLRVDFLIIATLLLVIATVTVTITTFTFYFVKEFHIRDPDGLYVHIKFAYYSLHIFTCF